MQNPGSKLHSLKSVMCAYELVARLCLPRTLVARLCLPRIYFTFEHLVKGYNSSKKKTNAIITPEEANSPKNENIYDCGKNIRYTRTKF